MKLHSRHIPAMWWLACVLVLTSAIYWPGLSGSWLFDDYPNIVDNPGVHPAKLSMSALVSAALSSPASSLKRPLASLSFAANYLLTGLDPFWMKLTNLIIHLLNGWLVFLLGRQLIHLAIPSGTNSRKGDICALLIATAWLLLPINVTAVLYVVQRMESLANVFVILGLLGYIAGRRMMLGISSPRRGKAREPSRRHGFALCVISLTTGTSVGLLAKETAAMLPLYAFIIEWILLNFQESAKNPGTANEAPRQDRCILVLFAFLLALPLVAGLSWLLPHVLDSKAWATRDFDLPTRMLSEARIVLIYILWTLLPTAHALSFYHDNFRVSSDFLDPWTTLPAVLGVIALFGGLLYLRRKRPLISLGLALYLSCHLLTGTILPLELIYEHRNYFASFGLLLALFTLLILERNEGCSLGQPFDPNIHTSRSWLASAKLIAISSLIGFWAIQTATTACAWGEQLSLARELAKRAPNSPRAQYELGRAYIIYSHYDPASPFTHMAYRTLERAADIPHSSILPQQALIFMNSRMRLPLEDRWWKSMVEKLRARAPDVQDVSSLASLTQCARDGACPLPKERMMEVFAAASAHPIANARLQAIYGNYAWNVLQDENLGLRMMRGAVKTAPNEPAYHITLTQMLMACRQFDEAKREIMLLKRLSVGDQLNPQIDKLNLQLHKQID